MITTTARVAGAIHSLTWDGKEFIDSYDHGRQMQSAANFDSGKDFNPEVFNPTEAGSNADGTGETSSSKLLRMQAGGSELQTTTQMAFWLAPGEKSLGNLARNEKVLSDHQVSKQVHIGVQGLPHAIEYEVVFDVPKGERHTLAAVPSLDGIHAARILLFLDLRTNLGRIEAAGRWARRAGFARGVHNAERLTRDGRVFTRRLARLRAIPVQRRESQ